MYISPRFSLSLKLYNDGYAKQDNKFYRDSANEMAKALVATVEAPTIWPENEVDNDSHSDI
jgi:hypothetical protein